MKQTCPYCRSGFEDPSAIIECACCGAAHHDACWELNGQCSVYGCRSVAVRIPRVNKIRWNFLPPALLFFGLIPSVQKVSLFLLLPLFLYTTAAFGSYLTRIRRA